MTRKLHNLKRVVFSMAIGLTTNSLTAQTINHRYEFNNNLADSNNRYDAVGTSNGGQFLAPSYSSDVPGSFYPFKPSHSIDLYAKISENEERTCAFEIDGRSVIYTDGGMSFWFKTEGVEDGDYLLFLDGSVEVKGNTAANSISLYVDNGQGLPPVTLPNTIDNPLFGTWHHLSFSWRNIIGAQNGNFTVYFDGEFYEELTISKNRPLNVYTNIRVGNYNPFANNNTDHQFHGKIYDLQLYSAQLAEDVVAAMYANPGVLANDAVQVLSDQNLNKDIHIDVFPNPFTDELYIAQQGGFDRVEVYDVAGKKVLAQKLATKKIALGSRLTSGIYYAKFTGAHGIVTKRIIKN